MNTGNPAAIVTLLFTDIEGSTRLWEQDPVRMPQALARHDELASRAVEDHRGVVVKMIGDGIHAAFDDPLDAVRAALQLQHAIADPAATADIPLRVRCGLHAGEAERRNNDFFGSTVNRAARIMRTAHGGQILLSQAVVGAIRERLPEGTTLRDMGSVRLRDLGSPERVYQVVHPDLRHSFPALRSLEATPNNLPQQVTSFVGRERGLAEVKKLLATSPLLTLLGMGGLGKTRLSLQVAADVMDDYPDGVWFVELASVADARLVPQAVASVLGVMEEAGRPVIEALLKFVNDRRLLVILDNCEHLVHACADLAKQLLQAGSGLRLLASSREHLHVPGETTYPVPALALPDPREAPSIEELLQYEAVRLFIDRATAVQPAFRVTPASASALAAICRRLDGIPLAIELAAARVRSMSVERIAERLHDRFQLLTQGNRTDMPRQQTLRALIDWSYDLLEAPEKMLFARLSVFAGCTLEAAESVGAGDAIDMPVLDLLSRLVDKSLVELDAGGERYRMLETVRQYAREKLGDSEDASATRSRHLEFFLALAEKVQRELWGPDQGTWLARLDLERENFLAAHAWCDHVDNGSVLGLRLVYSLQNYWLPRGLMELGYRVTMEALARPGAQARDLHRSGALYAAGQLTYFTGAYHLAKQHLEESLAIAREFAHKPREASIRLLLGYAFEALGERNEAFANFEASAAIAREMGDKGRLAFALNALAGLHSEVGDLDVAVSMAEEALSLTRELDDKESISIHLSNLARALMDRGVDDRTCGLVSEGLTIAREIGSERGTGNAVEVAAVLAVLHGAFDVGARFYGAVQARFAEIGLRRTPADDAFLERQIGKARTILGEKAFVDAESAGRTAPWEQMQDEVRAWLDHAELGNDVTPPARRP